MTSVQTALALGVTLACAIADARTGLIPNRLTYPALATIASAAALSGTLCFSCLGAFCVGGSLLLLHCITHGRGLGLGDVKLGTCIGAGLGPLSGMLALGSSFIIGGAVGSYLLLTHRAHRKTPIRFGPFLALGSCIALACETLR